MKVLHNGMEVPSHMYLETNGLYKVDFTPEGSGSYNVNVFFNDEEVRGLILFLLNLKPRRKQTTKFFCKISDKFQFKFYHVENLKTGKQTL